MSFLLASLSYNVLFNVFTPTIQKGRKGKGHKRMDEWTDLWFLLKLLVGYFPLKKTNIRVNSDRLSPSRWNFTTILHIVDLMALLIRRLQAFYTLHTSVCMAYASRETLRHFLYDMWRGTHIQLLRVCADLWSWNSLVV